MLRGSDNDKTADPQTWVIDLSTPLAYEVFDSFPSCQTRAPPTALFNMFWSTRETPTATFMKQSHSKSPNPDPHLSKTPPHSNYTYYESSLIIIRDLYPRDCKCRPGPCDQTTSVWVEKCNLWAVISSGIHKKGGGSLWHQHTVNSIHCVWWRFGWCESQWHWGCPDLAVPRGTWEGMCSLLGGTSLS